ncbi:hypothetical protein ANN_01243 [Periplaneta americana]|uniref:Uncharacterized protein n=1 Tax=Periplaneta americana TaxID=6978 RepID=A0ABQ8TVY0_PERAM|nr:hypothetical protein ANN_01243 [Periplaneta americana]
MDRCNRRVYRDVARLITTSDRFVCLLSDPICQAPPQFDRLLLSGVKASSSHGCYGIFYIVKRVMQTAASSVGGDASSPLNPSAAQVPAGDGWRHAPRRAAFESQLEVLVYATRPQTLDDLKHNITQEIQANNRVLQRVASNMERRVELCLMQDGGHFQHLL